MGAEDTLRRIGIGLAMVPTVAAVILGLVVASRSGVECGDVTSRVIDDGERAASVLTVVVVLAEIAGILAVLVLSYRPRLGRPTWVSMLCSAALLVLVGGFAARIEALEVVAFYLAIIGLITCVFWFVTVPIAFAVSALAGRIGERARRWNRTAEMLMVFVLLLFVPGGAASVLLQGSPLCD